MCSLVREMALNYSAPKVRGHHKKPKARLRSPEKLDKDARYLNRKYAGKGTQ